MPPTNANQKINPQATPDPGSVVLPADQQVDPGSIVFPDGTTPVQRGAMERALAPAWKVEQARAGANRDKLIDLLTRAGQARSHFAATHPALDTLGKLFPPAQLLLDPSVLLHSEAPEQYQKDTRALETRMHAPASWLTDLLTQTEYDPTTALGLSGATGTAMREGYAHAVPAVMRLWAKGAAHSGKVGGLTRNLGEAAAALHDFLTTGGHNSAEALRQEALENGAQGVRNYQTLYSLRNMRNHMAADLQGALTTGFRRALDKISDDDKLKIFRALHNGTIDQLPADLKSAAQSVQAYDRAIPYLSGSQTLRSYMEKKLGYSLPTDLKRFERSGTKPARGVVKADQFMHNHVPSVHEMEPDDAQKLLDRIEAGLPPGTDLAEWRNAQFLRRRGASIPLDNAKHVQEAFEASFRRASNSIAGADLQRDVAARFAPPKMVHQSVRPDEATIERAIAAYNKANPRANLTRDEFNSFTPLVQDAITRSFQQVRGLGETRSYESAPQHIREFFEEPGQKLPEREWELRRLQTAAERRDLYKDVSDISRSTMFTTPFQHQGRIGSLGLLNTLLNAPGVMPRAVGKFALNKFGLASADKRAANLGKAVRYGATGVPNIEQSKLEDALRSHPLPMKAGKWTSNKLADWFNFVQKSVWGWDDAVKSSLFDYYLKRDGDPHIAAYNVQRDMVDYGAKAPYTEALRTLSNFPIWRGQLPGAVVRGIMQNPQNAATIARAVPILAGAQIPKPGGKPGETVKLSSSAIGEAIEAFLEPAKYVRGTLSPTSKVAIDLLTRMALAITPQSMQKQYHGQWVYGQPGQSAVQSIGSLAAHEAPIVGQILSLTGHGMFEGTPQSNLLFQLLGLEDLQPRAKTREAPSKAELLHRLFPDLPASALDGNP